MNDNENKNDIITTDNNVIIELDEYEKMKLELEEAKLLNQQMQNRMAVFESILTQKELPMELEELAGSITSKMDMAYVMVMRDLLANVFMLSDFTDMATNKLFDKSSILTDDDNTLLYKYKLAQDTINGNLKTLQTILRDNRKSLEKFKSKKDLLQEMITTLTPAQIDAMLELLQNTNKPKK